MLPLHTQRLRLRAFTEFDLAPFVAYRSDPLVARYQGWDAPYSLQQAAAMLIEMGQLQPGLPGEWYQIAIERLEQPGLIGDCGFQVLANDTQQAEIGFTLAPEFQGRGYGREAVEALLAYLFGELRLHRVIAICDERNHASAQLLERVGMRREAHFIEHTWFKNRWASEYVYAVLDREWSLRKPVDAG